MKGIKRNNNFKFLQIIIFVMLLLLLSPAFSFSTDQEADDVSILNGLSETTWNKRAEVIEKNIRSREAKISPEIREKLLEIYRNEIDIKKHIEEMVKKGVPYQEAIQRFEKDFRKRGKGSGL